MCRDIQNLSSLLLQLLPRYANVAAIPTFCKRYGKRTYQQACRDWAYGTESSRNGGTKLQGPVYQRKSAWRTVGEVWFSSASDRVTDKIVITVGSINEAKAGKRRAPATYPGGIRTFQV